MDLQNISSVSLGQSSAETILSTGTADAVSMMTVNTVPFLNLNIPVLSNNSQGRVVLTAVPDGSGAFFLDAAGLALLNGQNTIYDESNNVLQFTTATTASTTSDNGTLQEVTTTAAAGGILTADESLIVFGQEENSYGNEKNENATAATENADTGDVLLPASSTMLKQLAKTTRHLNIDEIRPPVGKGPFKCDTCGVEFPKWNQLQRHYKKHADDKPFRCSSCEASFNHESNLRLHMATHTTSDPTCPECEKKFSRLASLRAHIMLHEKEEYLACSECGDEFNTQAQLDRHAKEHKEESSTVKYYSCQQCTQRFTRQALLREHMKIHYKIKASLSHRTYKRNIDRTTFPHKCTTCNKKFQKPSQLLRHNRIHTGERPFKCSVCIKAFNQKGALQIHMTRHNGVRPHRCEFCSASFSQRGNLRAHIQRVHAPVTSGNLSRFTCHECSCIFRKLGSLNAHLSRMHSGEMRSGTEGQKQDENVDDPEANHSAVIQHLMELNRMNNDVNSGVEEPKGSAITGDEDVSKGNADILQQALENSGLTQAASTKERVPSSPPKELEKKVQKSTEIKSESESAGDSAMVTTVADTATGLLKKHIFRVVGKVRYHQCMYCTKEFKKPSDLVRHIRIHTQEKPFKCDHCFRAFAVKSTLTAHVRTHSGVKQFRCDVCSKMFSTQGSLKVHLRLHTGSKPFTCSKCNKSFRTSGHMKSHMLSHSKGDSSLSSRRVRLKSTSSGDGALLNGSNKLLTELQDIPLQEPIYISETGYIQFLSKNASNTTIERFSNSSDRPHKCDYCSSGFKKSSHLKQHIRSHTGEKPFKCNQCTRSFVSNGVLKAHVKTHLGVKSHKCDICSATFTTNGSLKRHMCTHTSARPFMCPYCQKTFKTSVNCKKHMKIHRSEIFLQSENSGVTVTVVSQPSQVTENGTIEIADGNTAVISQELSGSLADSLASVNPNDVTGQNHSVQPQIVNVENSVLESENQDSSVQEAQVINIDDGTLRSDGGLTVQQFVSAEALTQENFQQLQQSLTQQVLEATPALPGDLDQNNFFTQTLNQLSSSDLGSNQFTLQTENIDVGALANSLVTASSLGPEPLTAASISSILPSGQDAIPEECPAEGDTAQNLLAVEPSSDGTPENSQTPGRRKIFRCEICNKVFKKACHLKTHSRSHTGEKPFRCSTCSNMFTSVTALNAHIRSSHIGVKHKCDLCHTEFGSYSSLRRHLKIHSDERPYICSICNTRCNTEGMLKRHMANHRDKETPQDEEPEGVMTEEQTETQDALESSAENISLSAISMHRRRTAVIKLSEEQSDELAKKDPNKTASMSEKALIASAAEKHRISVIKDKVQELDSLPRHPNQCDHCPKSFKKPSDLVRHVRIHTGEKPFICSVCSKNFTVKSTLDTHLKTHKGEKNYLCHVCNSYFSTMGSLKVHMRLHTGARPFKCPHCDLQFRTSGHRKSHIATHFKHPSVKKKKPFFPEPQTSAIETETGQAVNFLSTLNTGDLNNEILQGGESYQLQIAPGIQITGISPSLLNQTLQIDASFLQQLQQLQQQGNINISINSNILPSVPTSVDGSLIQNTLETTDGSVTSTGQLSLGQNIIMHPLSNLTLPLTSQGSLISADANTKEVIESDGLTDGASTFDVSSIVQQAKEAEDIQNEVEATEEPTETLIDAEDCMEDGSNEPNVIVSITEDNILEENGTVTNGDEIINIKFLNDPIIEMPNTSSVYSERAHICNICNKAFKRSSHLKEHYEVHKSAEERVKAVPHQCSQCSKAFAKPSQLKRHERIHTGERPYVCTVCDKAFNQKNALEIHMKKHTGEKPYKCLMCSSVFTQKGNLMVHLKRVHGCAS